MRTVAILTTPVARHELYTVAERYRVITTRPDEEPTDLMRLEYGRQLTREQAGDWIETVKACGGVVHQREMVA